MRLRGIAALAGILALALPGAAIAAGQSSTPAVVTTPSLTGGSTPSTSTTPAHTGPYTVPNTTSSSSSGGLSSGDEIAIFVAAALLLGGIARYIMSDSRGHTPSRAVADLDSPRATVRPLQHRVKRARAKGKRARRARRAGR
jgi:hypothetical protein